MAQKQLSAATCVMVAITPAKQCLWSSTFHLGSVARLSSLWHGSSFCASKHACTHVAETTIVVPACAADTIDVRVCSLRQRKSRISLIDATWVTCARQKL